MNLCEQVSIKEQMRDNDDFLMFRLVQFLKDCWERRFCHGDERDAVVAEAHLLCYLVGVLVHFGRGGRIAAPSSNHEKASLLRKRGGNFVGRAPILNDAGDKVILR